VVDNLRSRLKDATQEFKEVGAGGGFLVGWVQVRTRWWAASLKAQEQHLQEVIKKVEGWWGLMLCTAETKTAGIRTVALSHSDVVPRDAPCRC